MTQPPVGDQAFQDFLAEGRLMGSRCGDCDELFVPPRRCCKNCHRETTQWTEVEGRGKLVAFTCIYIGPPWMARRGFGRDNPYCCGVVQLVAGPRLVARIEGVDAARPQTIEIGTPVTMVDGAVPPEIVFRTSS